MNKRESNFELLRIVSMFFIIAHHFMVHGLDIESNLYLTGVNKFVVPFFWCGGKLGIALFCMITGYFMIKSKISIKKAIMLELQVLFYSIGILLFFLFIENRTISFYSILKSIFPNIFRNYWFFSSYFILFLLIPYINKLLLSLRRKEFLGLLVICLIFFIIIPTILIFNTPFSQDIYLIFYYLVGAYIKLFIKNSKFNFGYLIGFILSYLCIVISSILFIKLSSFNYLLQDYIYSFARPCSFLIFISSICLFLFFKNLRIKYYKIINVLGSVSFGVYLFHDHPLIRTYLWKEVFNIPLLVNSSRFVIYGIIIIFIVYFIGGIIDIVRQVLFKYFEQFISKKVNISKGS